MLDALVRYFYSPAEYLLRKSGVNKSTRFALYGAGEFGVEIGLIASSRGILPSIWVDSYPKNYPSKVLGMTILDAEVLIKEDVDIIIVCSIKYASEILNTCLELGIPKSKVISLI